MSQALITSKNYDSYTINNNFSFSYIWGSQTSQILPLYVDSPKLLIPSTQDVYKNDTTLYYDKNNNSWNDAENFIFMYVQTALMTNKNYVNNNFYPIYGNNENAQRMLAELDAYLTASTGLKFYKYTTTYSINYVAQGLLSGGIINELFKKPDDTTLNPTSILRPYDGLYYNEVPQSSSTTINTWISEPQLINPGYYVDTIGTTISYGFNLPYNDTISGTYNIGAPPLFEPIDIIHIEVEWVYNQTEPDQPETRIGPKVNYTRFYYGIAPKDYIFT